MKHPLDEIYRAAKDFDFEDVIIIGMTPDGGYITMHTTDDVETTNILDGAASQIRTELLEMLVGRFKSLAN